MVDTKPSSIKRTCMQALSLCQGRLANHTVTHLSLFSLHLFTFCSIFRKRKMSYSALILRRQRSLLLAFKPFLINIFDKRKTHGSTTPVKNDKLMHRGKCLRRNGSCISKTLKKSRKSSGCKILK